MAATAAIAIPAAVSAGTGIWGAANQNSTNRQNYAAQQQHQQMIQGYINQLMPQGANPFSQQIEQFIGGGQGQTADSNPAGMYRYQSPGAFTYEPSMAGQVPQIGGLPQVKAGNVYAPQAQGQFNFDQAQATGTQAFNTGQDALMQMLRGQGGQPPTDPTTTMNLQNLAAGDTQYNQSNLFGALDAQAKNQLDQQVAQLQGSAGSLGQRFGTGMMNQEGQLRNNFMTNLNANEQQLGMQSFEAAQGRRQPALNSILQAQQFQQQQGLNTASALAGFGQAGTQMNLQASLANQQAQQQANQQFNQMSQFNAGQGLQASQQNAQLGLQGQQSNLDAYLRAALSNQGVQSQYGLANQQAQNQAGQFNAGQRTQADQFGAQQGNIFNNMMMQAMGQAGNFQQGQNSFAAQLIGLLNGQQVPQQQPSALPGSIGDASGTAMMLPFLMQMFQQQGQRGGQQGSGNYVPNAQQFIVPYGGAQPG